MEILQVDMVYKALLNAWSLQSSSKWLEDNPTKGQCGVTALVVNDLLGAEIRKTKLDECWHYYNFIDGERYDFTASQFSEAIAYTDLPSKREEAFTDTNSKQYHYLKQSVMDYLKNT
ncbi:hypothetical protein DS745_03840 [Anaerobacillus alkaliphilus]|uniref:YunG n=1 Tax=Anaerobacillus alkaliphilus TaxID=1548597 RepID=A0A4Q0VXV2_9BACI|nr:hypothetical protein [Anaerobacillus alkaliphilus]RXJ04524.1 hypothetical protein DS745_03840 [Anaerobacillus alkaliphilus]